LNILLLTYNNIFIFKINFIIIFINIIFTYINLSIILKIIYDILIFFNINIILIILFIIYYSVIIINKINMDQSQEIKTIIIEKLNKQ
jgi:hypothetical protein